MISWLERAGGHARTCLADACGWLHGAGPTALPLSVTVEDPIMGAVRLRGLLGGDLDAETLVVIVPGITGTAQSWYCAAAAWEAERRGFAHVRIGMRGTDRSGEDIWHGGLTDDLRATLAHPWLARFRRVLLLGYSVGGHVALWAAVERIDPRVRAVAALCSPLDLELGTQFFDQPERRPYRCAVMTALDEIYAATARVRPLPVPVEVVRRARTSRERDALAIAPRFGFRSAEDYYARASVAPRLPELRIPALVVAARADPVVPPAAITPALHAARDAVTVRWVRGGHLAFAAGADLGFGPVMGVEPQVLEWMHAA